MLFKCGQAPVKFGNHDGEVIKASKLLDLVHKDTAAAVESHSCVSVIEDAMRRGTGAPRQYLAPMRGEQWIGILCIPGCISVKSEL